MEQNNIKYEVRRKINVIHLVGELYTYREEISLGDRKTIKENIATKENIEKIQLDEEIENSNYNLFHKEVISAVKNIPFNFNTSNDRGPEIEQLKNKYDKFNTYLIQEPYSYVKNNGKKDTEVLFLDYATQHLRNLFGVPYPKAFYFDSIHGNVNDKIYCLDEVLEILKSRNDIEILNGGIRRGETWEKGNSITNILEFIWRPSLEDFYKVLKEPNTFLQYNKIKEEIFGFKRID